MAKNELEKARNLVAQFIEECGADALVVVYSKVRKQRTETYVIPYGNAHTCNALIDYAYENYNPPELELADTEEDE